MNNASGFYWANIGGEWEVVQMCGDVFYRAGSDVEVRRFGSVWIEHGMALDVQGITGPIEPPSALAAQQGGATDA